MGSDSVYKVLKELFPQVDSRLLKAVSLEHSKDADAAVEVVLVEIVPFLPEQLLTVGSSSNSQSSLNSFDDSGKSSQVESTMDHIVVNPCSAEHSTEARVSSIDGSLFVATEALDADFSAQLNSHTVVEPVNLEPPAMSFDHDLSSETEANCDDVPPLLETWGESNSMNADSNITILTSENVSLDNQVCLKTARENADNKTLVTPESNLLVRISGINLAATQKSDPSCSSKAIEKDDCAVKIVSSEDELEMTFVLTRSEQICSTGYLDEVIEDAKNHKKTLMLAMDSVIELMKAVESKEKAAEQAKEDATWGCSDILAKVDEVKHALSRAKEANDMHAGEVNAEKAILATELRELQLRLFTLSDDKNISLGILYEMRKALEVRMAAALEEIATAEDEKLERERSAREALMHQENEMEKVVEESKKLKLEAEENSKLQEFLMDRGRAIDILQGELAVKCQDVLLLKEMFDKRIPLTGSLFSSPKLSTLASSSSSFRSALEPETETYETVKKSLEVGDSYGVIDKSCSSDDALLPIETANGEVKKVDELKGLLDDDGWELFDNNGLLIR